MATFINEHHEAELVAKYGADRVAAQVAIEERMGALGAARYLKQMDKAAERGAEDRTHYGKQLVKHYIGAIEEGIAEYLGSMKRVQQQGKILQMIDPKVLAYVTIDSAVSTISTDGVSYSRSAISVGALVEDLVRDSIAKDQDVAVWRAMNRAAEKKGDLIKKRESAKAVLAQTGLQRIKWMEKAGYELAPEEHARLSAIGKNPIVAFDPWTPGFRLHVGSVLLEIVLAKTPLLEKYTTMANNRSVARLTATPATLDWIQKIKGQAEASAILYLPMVIPPRPWSSQTLTEGCYHTKIARPLRLVKEHTKAQTEQLAHNIAADFYAGVNGAQETAWTINQPVADVLRQLWKMENNMGIDSMPELSMPVAPLKPTWVAAHSAERKALRLHNVAVENNEPSTPPALSPDYAERDAIFTRWKNESEAYHRRANKVTGQLVTFTGLMSLIETYSEHGEFYFPYTVDFRGRLYCVTSCLSPQGADYAKGVLRFAEGVKLGFYGGYWLMVHAANLFGRDKLPFPQRVRWVRDNLETLLEVAKDPIGTTGIWGGGKVNTWHDKAGKEVSADKPFQALAVCLELAGMVSQGSEFVSHLAVALDGSCSGLQNLAMALQCSETAGSVNVVPTPQPSDIYAEVAALATKQLHNEWNTEVPEGKTHSPADYAEQWKKFLTIHFGSPELNRNITKRPTMTFSYGSKASGFTDQIMADTLKGIRESLIEEHGGADTEGYRAAWPFDRDGYMAASYLAQVIYRAICAKVDRPAQAMTWFQEATSMLIKQKIKFTEKEHAKRMEQHKEDPETFPQEPKMPLITMQWRTICGFTVVQHCPNTKLLQIDIPFMGKRFCPSILVEQPKPDVKKMRDGIAPNVVHSMDGSHLQLVVATGLENEISSFALIHDSFGTHAGRTQRFSKVIKEAFFNAYNDNDVMADLYEQWLQDFTMHGGKAQKFPTPPEKGSLDISSVLKSRYAFA